MNPTPVIPTRRAHRTNAPIVRETVFGFRCGRAPWFWFWFCTELAAAMAYAFLSSDISRSIVLSSSTFCSALVAQPVPGSNKSSTFKWMCVVGAKIGSPGVTTGRSFKKSPQKTLPSSNVNFPVPCFWLSTKPPT